jgi:hypothetical protein
VVRSEAKEWLTARIGGRVVAFVEYHMTEPRRPTERIILGLAVLALLVCAANYGLELHLLPP